VDDQVTGAALEPADERDLVAQLTREVLGQAAPEEIEIFEADATGWLEGRHETAASREDMVGFGVEAAVALLTPYVVAAATAAVRYLAGVLREGADAEVRPRLLQWVRRLLGHDADDGPHTRPHGLPVDVVSRVRDVTLTTCIDMGLGKEDATLVSDTIAGRLVLPSP
jgi:hypothetical protein